MQSISFTETNIRYGMSIWIYRRAYAQGDWPARHGKTTLINCITGALPVQSGTIVWHEAGAPPCDLLRQAPDQRALPGIGYVPQDRRIFRN